MAKTENHQEHGQAWTLRLQVRDGFTVERRLLTTMEELAITWAVAVVVGTPAMQSGSLFRDKDLVAEWGVPVRE